MLCNVNWVKVNDMYIYAKEISLPLLSNFNSAFWGAYVTNYETYDKYFMQKYKTFMYYQQDPFSEENTIELVTNEFIDNVKNYLLMNNKKYSELFKVELMNVSSLDNDFFIDETSTGGKNVIGNYTSGNRKDTDTQNIGQRTDNGYNRKDPTTNTQEKSIKAFNSASYIPNEKVVNTMSSEESNYTDVTGNQTINNTFNKGIQNDNESRNENTNGRIITKGYHNNPNDNLRKYISNWDSWSLYERIFNDIANELLIV